MTRPIFRINSLRGEIYLRKRKRNSKAERAQGLVRLAIRDKKLPYPEDCLCWICCIGRWENPKVNIIYHHVDYDKPLDVFPLCRNCHIRLHIAIGDYPYRSRTRIS